MYSLLCGVLGALLDTLGVEEFPLIAVSYSWLQEHFRDDSWGKRKAFYFLPWHFSFFCRSVMLLIIPCQVVCCPPYLQRLLAMMSTALRPVYASRQPAHHGPPTAHPSLIGAAILAAAAAAADLRAKVVVVWHHNSCSLAEQTCLYVVHDQVPAPPS